MSERIELSEKDMAEVAGGVFHYQYNSKGEYVCIVDSCGAFYAQESAKRKINMHDIEMGGLPEEELVEWAIGEGLLWRP